MVIVKTLKQILIVIILITSIRASAYTLKTYRVSMRDGTRLATDVYLPWENGRLPVIMIRTPNGRKGQQRFAAAAIKHGYGFVVQDTRGRFDSQGVDYPVFVHDGWGEHKDGYDTVEWIASRDF